jgi:hypothetical protein
MNPDSFHKILEPYLWATALAVAILLVTVYLLWRDGRRREEIEREVQSRPNPPGAPMAGGPPA